MKKYIFYFILSIVNILALVFIGISFLNGASAGGLEGAVQYSGLQLFFRLLLYILIVSVFFSICAFSTGFLFRKSLAISSHVLKKIFIGELSFFVAVFFIAYVCVYMI